MNLRERVRRHTRPVAPAVSTNRVFDEPLGDGRWLVRDGDHDAIIVGEVCREHDRYAVRLWTSEADSRGEADFPSDSCADHSLALLYFEDYLAALEIGT